MIDNLCSNFMFSNFCVKYEVFGFIFNIFTVRIIENFMLKNSTLPEVKYIWFWLIKKKRVDTEGFQHSNDIQISAEIFT